MNQKSYDAYIMIVADTPANLKLLGELLKSERYHPRSYPKGQLALHAALTEPQTLVDEQVSGILAIKGDISEIPLATILAISKIAEARYDDTRKPSKKSRLSSKI